VARGQPPPRSGLYRYQHPPWSPRGPHGSRSRRVPVADLGGGKANQGVNFSDLPGFSLYLNTLVTVDGTDVFVITNFSGTNDAVSTASMLKLVNRTMKLR